VSAQLPVQVHRTRVEWVDTDAAGIHHHSTVTRFVEAAEAALVRRLGIDGYFQVAPRRQWQVDYTASLRFGQEVTTELRVARVGRSSLTLAFEVWGEPHEGRPRTRAAHGSYVTVHVDGSHDTGVQSSPWPPAWQALLTGAVYPRGAGGSGPPWGAAGSGSAG